MPYLSHRDDIETLEPGESIDGIIKGMTQESQTVEKRDGHAVRASDDARFVTGVNLPVDAGLTASNGQPPLS